MFLFHHRRTPKELTEAARVYLLAGLGNPGREYRDSRHNAGFMVMDHLAADLDIKITRVQNKALVGTGMVGDTKVVLAKPQTYMNLSGEAVAGLVRFYKIPIDHLLIIHDDIDLPFGVIRLRPDGGSGGQKGVQSIIDHLGTQDFPRLRFGIGRPPGSKSSAAYVLKTFSPEEQKELVFLLDQAAAALRLYLSEGLEAAMNRYNGSQLGG